jgi:hypothetical protein
MDLNAAAGSGNISRTPHPGAVDLCGRRGGPCFMHLVTSDTPKLCYAAVW